MMRTVYSYKSPVDGLIIANSPANCRQCITLCDSGNEIISCQIYKEKRRRGVLKDNGAVTFVCTNEAVKSSRLFLEKRRVIRELIPSVDNFRQDERRRITSSIKRLIHNLISLNAQSIQAVHSKIPQDEFAQPNRYDLISVVEKYVAEDTTGIAKLLIDLLKNEKLEKTEFSSYGKLFENEPISTRPYAIHKIVLLILNSFWNDFKEKEVGVVIKSCYDKVIVDYDVIAATLVYIMDNATKYVLPDSTFEIRFENYHDRVCVIFDMVSTKIEPGEEFRIFEEGYSGVNPKKLNRSGSGLGLSLAARLLSLINGNLTVERDCNESRRRTRVGIEFENNVFTLSLPRFKG